MPADLKDYRAARRAFIAACEKAGVDTIARVHPGKAADGKPLFLDSAALGPRLAAKALLTIGIGMPGCAILTTLLRDKIVLPQDARLILVHAPDSALADVDEGRWLRACLQSVATEDLSRVHDLAVLALDGHNETLKPALQTSLPEAAIQSLPPARTHAQAHDAIAMFLALQEL